MAQGMVLPFFARAKTLSHNWEFGRNAELTTADSA